MCIQLYEETSFKKSSLIPSGVVADWTTREMSLVPESILANKI